MSFDYVTQYYRYLQIFDPRRLQLLIYVIYVAS